MEKKIKEEKINAIMIDVGTPNLTTSEFESWYTDHYKDSSKGLSNISRKSNITKENKA